MAARDYARLRHQRATLSALNEKLASNEALLDHFGARVREIPVRHRPRLHGTAKYGIGNRLFRALADLMAVRWMRKRWIDPHRAEEVKR